MSHEVENMFSVAQTPWHGLGKVVSDAPTAQTAIQLAGLDWKVLENKLTWHPDGKPDLVSGWKLLSRDTDNQVLGIVGENYHPLQNDKAFEFFNPFIESGLAQFETAGSLRQGKTVWILARLNKAPIEISKNDRVVKFLLLSNGHDGTMAVRVGFTPVRVVCANTLAMSHANGESRLLRLFHSSKLSTRMEQVQEIVNAADAKFEATAEQYRALAKRDVDQKSLEAYVDVVFGYSEQLEADRQSSRRRKMVEDITRLFETGRGQDLKGARGTYWGLYNSVTEYLSYEAGRSEATRLNALWFGQNKNLNQVALNVATKMAVGL